jgi:hypothetical protein
MVKTSGEDNVGVPSPRKLGEVGLSAAIFFARPQKPTRSKKGFPLQSLTQQSA